jgi:predicted transcriptional regulator of viral defense system
MRRIRIDTLASIGSIFTISEARKLWKSNNNVTKTLLSRYEKAGWIERLERGRYMIIPLGSQKGKYTLNEFAIGSALATPSCIGYWSALHYHGLTEQIPLTVFVQTTARRSVPRCKIFGVPYRIVRLKGEKMFGMEKALFDGNIIHITNKEKTLIDCLDKPHLCGGIVEVAKALYNGKFDFERLLDYGRRIGNSGVLRRLGYLVEYLDLEVRVPRPNTRNYLLLDPSMPPKGPANGKWRLRVNLDDKVLGTLE